MMYFITKTLAELIAILKKIGSCMGVMQYSNISLKIKFDSQN